ncbi:MAG: DegV family protein [Anaerolineales bacterium]|jgi:DegV family protein with EDD domain
MIRIITDSTADLNVELAQARQVETVPLSVYIGGKTYQDGLELRSENLFPLVEQTGELPKTAAPSAGEFQKVFEQPGECIYIGISSGLSASVQNARVGAQDLEAGKVRIIDSLNVSSGTGLLVLRAADLRDQGCSADEIEREILALVPKLRTIFIIDTMEYLYKGGRCSALQMFAGSLLKIRPIIDIKPDGTMGVKDKSRGSRRKGLQMLLDDLESQLQDVNPQRVCISHTGCYEDADFMVSEISRLLPGAEVLSFITGSVVSSHGGPNTLGLEFILK